jgi:hypothetical protein
MIKRIHDILHFLFTFLSQKAPWYAMFNALHLPHKKQICVSKKQWYLLIMVFLLVHPAKAQQAEQKAPIDFSQLPSDIQARMNLNKASGKSIMTGINRCYTVKIAVCNSAGATKKTLSFLHSEKKIKKVEFISDGIVKIITDPEYDSVLLKEKLAEKGLKFIFIDKVYCLPTQR